MHIDFKVTAWERVEIPQGFEDKALELIKSGAVNSANDLFEKIECADDMDCDFIVGAEEQMTPHENDNEATIEVYKEHTNYTAPSEPIWTNKIEK